MDRVSASIPETRGGSLALSPAALGTACCIASAILYTAANICMRQVSALHCDPIWALFCKESVTALIAAPILLAQAYRGTLVVPRRRTLAMLVAVGLAVEVVANVGWLWALGVVGLAVAISADFGTMLIASAVLGRAMLGEHVSPRTMYALGMLLLAIVVLSCGAGEVSRSVAANPGTLPIALAIAMVCLAGVIYAVLGTAMRHSLTGTTSLSIVLFIIPFIGTLSLGPITYCRFGVQPLLNTPWEQYGWMLAAGIMNLVAFLAIGRGLQLATLVRVNMLNVSQVAMASIGGILWFHEKSNIWLLLGIGLTIAGIFVMDGAPNQQITDQHT
jgi:drug/metabolite transporter (DMT)-like permease